MSKKSFYRISWKEVLVLFILDFAVLMAFMDYVQCSSNRSVVIVTPQLTCTLLFTVMFIFNPLSLIYVFAVFLIINFILSAIWHFVVKK